MATMSDVPVATSAIEAFNWLAKDMKLIEAVLWKLGRRLFYRWGNTIGEDENGNENYKAIKSEEVRKRLRLPTLATERDTKQLHKMLATPENYVHELAALFGVSKIP